MLKVFIATSNASEGQILEMTFSQRSFQVQLSATGPSNYLEFVQFKPDVIIMEITSEFIDQCATLKLVRQNRKIKKTPIIGYGYHKKVNSIHQFISSGLTKFFIKPLRIGLIFSYMQEVFKEKGIELTTLDAPKAVPQSEINNQLLSASLTKTEKLLAAKNHVSKLFAFPFTIPKIIECTQSSQSGASDLAKALVADSAITSTILKTSNSLHFATNGRKISTIKEAIVRIGFNEVKKIALGLSVMNLVKKEDSDSSFDRTDFWYQALASGIISESIATGLKHPNPTLAFLSGLLHELGVLLFDEFFNDLFEKCLQEASSKSEYFHIAQEGTLGFNHSELLAELFISWKLPNELITLQKGSLSCEETPKDVDENTANLLHSLGMGHLLSRALCIGSSADNVIKALPNNWIEQNSLSDFVTDSFFDNVKSSILTYTKFLNLEPRVYPFSERVHPAKKVQIAVINYSKESYQPHLLFLKTLAIFTTDVSDPSEIQACLDEYDINLILIILDPKTPLADFESYISAYKMIGEVQGKPKAQILALSPPEGIVRVEDASKSCESLSTTVDTLRLEYSITTLYEKSMAQ